MKRILFGLLALLTFCVSCNNDAVSTEGENDDFNKEKILNSLIGRWTLSESYYIINEKKQLVDAGDSPYYVHFLMSGNNNTILKVEYSSLKDKQIPRTIVTNCIYLSKTEIEFNSFSYVIRDNKDGRLVKMKYFLEEKTLTLSLDIQKDNSVFYRIYKKQ